MNSIFFFFNPILLSTVQLLVMCDSFLDFEISEFSQIYIIENCENNDTKGNCVILYLLR